MVSKVVRATLRFHADYSFAWLQVNYFLRFIEGCFVGRLKNLIVLFIKELKSLECPFSLQVPQNHTPDLHRANSLQEKLFVCLEVTQPALRELKVKLTVARAIVDRDQVVVVLWLRWKVSILVPACVIRIGVCGADLALCSLLLVSVRATSIVRAVVGALDELDRISQ